MIFSANSHVAATPLMPSGRTIKWKCGESTVQVSLMLGVSQLCRATHAMSPLAISQPTNGDGDGGGPGAAGPDRVLVRPDQNNS